MISILIFLNFIWIVCSSLFVEGESGRSQYGNKDSTNKFTTNESTAQFAHKIKSPRLRDRGLVS